MSKFIGTTHTLGSGSGFGLGSGAGSPLPTITSLSQNAGTINGGTVVSVVGTNFLSGMTSNLGTVSSITATTCNITTSSASAGVLGMTITTSGGTSSPTNFTYLAHPGTPSISPSSGPSSATQAATITSSSLPFGFSGVPFSITVGGATTTSLTATASTTATATIPSGGTVGTANVVVSVDGVSATGTNIYTFVAAPTFTLSTPNIGSAAGGWTVVLTGTNFVSGSTVSIAGVAATSVVVNSATQITCKAPAFSTPNGTSTGQTITITTAGGSVSGSATATKYFYLPSNNTIEQFQRADVGVTVAAGKVSAWADQSGNNNNWAQATSANQPAAPTGNFASTGLPSIAFNGTTSYMTCGAFPIGMTTACQFQVMTITNPNNTQVFSQIGGATSSNLYCYTVSPSIYMANNSVGGAQYQIAGPSDSNPHIISASNAYTDLKGGRDATINTLTVPSVSINNSGATNYLGCDTQIGLFTNMNMLVHLIYAGALSTADYNMVLAVLRAVSGTP